MAEAKNRFYQFIQETGLNWNDYEDFARGERYWSDAGVEFNPDQAGPYEPQPKSMFCVTELIRNALLRRSLRPKD